MTLEGGLLGGLTINDRQVLTETGKPMAGGSLAGLFSVRDEVMTAVQLELDTVALDLIERFETGVDDTLATGLPGLFSDGGSVAGQLTGLSGRIALNALADPDQGGAVWRIRDGLGSTGPSNSGNADLLQSMLDALSETRISTSDSLGQSQRSAAGLVSDLGSAIWTRINQTDQTVTFAASRPNKSVFLFEE